MGLSNHEADAVLPSYANKLGFLGIMACLTVIASSSTDAPCYAASEIAKPRTDGVRSGETFLVVLGSLIPSLLSI